MSAIKERIIGAVSIMNEKDAEKVWNLIQATFALANAPEEQADNDEIEIMQAYRNGNPDYQATISHSDVLKELGL